MLPEFADPGALPAALGFGDGQRLPDEVGEVSARVGGDGFAIPVEGETGGQLVGNQLELGGPLEGQDGPQEASNLERPALVVIATRYVQGEAWSIVEPRQADPEQMRPTGLEKFAGGGGIESFAVERLNILANELRGEALGELLLLFSRPSGAKPAVVARPFAGLRFAPASSGLATTAVPIQQSHFELPPVSFCSHPNIPTTGVGPVGCLRPHAEGASRAAINLARTPIHR